MNQQATMGGWNNFYQPQTPASNRLKRVGKHFLCSRLLSLTLPETDWLRDRTYFETVIKDDSYVVSRLGFMAPNIVVMKLTAFYT